MQPPAIPATAAPQDISLERRAALMDKARQLEAGFLAEMLALAGLDEEGGAFSGGIGADQFASFLRDAQARAIVGHGGIGLAEQLFNSLARRDHGQG